MNILKNVLSEIVARSKPLQYILITGCFVFSLVWINRENLAAQQQLQELLRASYELQGLCEDELIELRKDIRRLEAEIYKIKYE
jgi:hypothetical protein